MATAGTVFIKAPEHDAAAGNASLEDAVRSIVAAVRERGDAAVREFSRRFDGMAPETLEVPYGNDLRPSLFLKSLA